HYRRNPERNNPALSDMQDRQGALVIDAYAYPSLHDVAQALRFDVIGGIELDRFIIEQAVDQMPIRCRIEVIQLPQVQRPPFSKHHGKYRVNDERDQYD